MKLPQLSLRDLFWLVLVCALVLGWWDRRALVGAHRSEADEWKQERDYLNWRMENPGGRGPGGGYPGRRT